MSESLAQVGQRRLTLFEQINRIELDGDEAIFNLMEELKADEVEAAGFRWHAYSTQKDQDRTLELCELINYLRMRSFSNNLTAYLPTYVFFQNPPPYPPKLTVILLFADKKFLRLQKILPNENDETLSEKDQDLIMFPTEKRTLHTNARYFVIFVARFAPGLRGRMTYSRLARYRLDFIFWTNRIHDKYGLERPSKSMLYNQITEAMRFASKKYQLSAGGIRTRSGIGLNELRQLIDLDMTTTPSMDNAEGHHLAWLLGRVCCVRPGSIGWSHREYEKTGQYLTWGDVRITRTEEKGRFVAEICFRTLKTNFDDPERGRNKPNPLQELKTTIVSPSSLDALVFSIPHRLLTMAIRRGLLVGINTIDELFNGTNYEILVRFVFYILSVNFFSILYLIF